MYDTVNHITLLLWEKNQYVEDNFRRMLNG
jgi:hypothetical protein